MATAGEQYILRMIVDVQNEQALKGLDQNLRSAGKGLQTYTKQARTSAGGSRQLGFAFQSAGFQITDFAVQVQGGVSATRALSQQLPQLLAGFNILTPAFAFTTAALATLAALLPLIVRKFNELTDATPDLADVLKEVETGVKSLNTRLQTFDSSKYVEALKAGNEATQEFNQNLLVGNLRIAEERIEGTAASLKQAFNDIQQLSAGQQLRAGAGSFVPGGGQLNLEQQRALAREQTALAESLRQANLEQVFGSNATAFAALFESIDLESLNIEDFTDQFVKLFAASDSTSAQIETLRDQIVALRQAQEELDAASAGSLGLPNGGNNGAGGSGDRFTAADILIQENDLRQMLFEREQERIKKEEADAERKAIRMQRERDAIVTQAQAYATSLLPATEQYRLELEQLNLQIDTYNLSQETADALTEQLTAKYRAQAEAVKETTLQMTAGQEFMNTAFETFDQNFQAFTDGLARGTADVKDLFKNMAAAIIGDLLRIYAAQLITGLVFGGGRGVTGSTAGIPTSLDPSAFLAKGGVLKNGVQMFANGGVVNSPTMFPMARGVGVMGEAGAEGIFPLGRLPNGDLGVQGAPMNVTINNNAAGVEVNATQGDGGLTIDIVRQVVASDIARGGNAISSAVAGSFGLQRAGV
jgi:hypothetical protein